MLALGSYGIDVPKLLAKEGLTVPSNRDNPEHIPTVLAEKFIELAVRETGDQAFAIKIAEHVYPTTMKEFGISLLSSNTLRDCIQRLAKYYPILCTNQKLSFEQQQDQASLSSVYSDTSIDLITQGVWVEIPIALAVRFIRLIYKPDYIPLKLELTRPYPEGAADRYRQFFGIDPCFDTPRNALYFGLDELDAPLPGSSSELAAEHELRVIKRLANLHSDNLTMQVHALLLEELPGNRINKEGVAKRFAMCPKTFHNRLHEAGTSFQKILDGARLELAEQFLSRNDLLLEDIAYQLGYSDASSFSRAYKRWTGHAPKLGHK